MQQYDNITLDVAEQALRAVSPDMPRKEWARMALAMYDEFGDAAFDAWDRWSQGGATYDPKAAKTTWRSCSRASGATRVGVAAVIWAAQQTGWTLPSRGTPRAEDVAKMAAERARRDRERAERRAAQDAAAAEDHAAAAGGAAAGAGAVGVGGVGGLLGARGEGEGAEAEGADEGQSGREGAEHGGRTLNRGGGAVQRTGCVEAP